MIVKALNRNVNNPGRLWTYSRDSWEPKYRWLPRRGSDEYGRLTLVLPIPFGGYVVYAWRSCRCRWCVDARAERERMEDAKYAAYDRETDIRNLVSKYATSPMSDDLLIFMFHLQEILENDYDDDA